MKFEEHTKYALEAVMPSEAEASSLKCIFCMFFKFTSRKLLAICSLVTSQGSAGMQKPLPERSSGGVFWNPCSPRCC